MIIWFKGISGVGKSTLGRFYYLKKKKKKKNLIFLDGDIFRSLFNNDLGYSLNDRNRNANRLCNFVKFLDLHKINVIISANLTSKKYRIWAKKNLKNYISILIESDLSILQKRDKKKIYEKKKNIVGIDISYKKPDNCDIYIKNNSNKKYFLNNAKIIDKMIKQKKLTIY